MAGGFGSRRGQAGGAPATGEIKAYQDGSIEGENDPAIAVEATVAVATTAAYGDDGKGAPATGASGGMVKKRMSEAEIHSILFRERRELAPDTSNMTEEEVEIIRGGVEAFNALSNDFAEYQAEVRAQYEAKGYVEEEDGLDECSEEEWQWLREQLADLFDGLDFSDHVQEEDEEEQAEQEEDGYSNESEEEGEAPESKFE